jgi:hypothetical protein
MISEQPTLLCSCMSPTQQENQPARSTFPENPAKRLPHSTKFLFV